jgi:hypothetical protein
MTLTLTAPVARARNVEPMPLSGHRTAIATALDRYADLLERRIAADRLALAKVRFALSQIGGPAAEPVERDTWRRYP